MSFRVIVKKLLKKAIVKKLFKVLVYSMYESGWYYEFREKYNIHPTFVFNGNNILFYGKGKITCGAESYIGSNSRVLAWENNSITIGKKCHIAYNVRIETISAYTNQDINDYTVKDGTKRGNVEIGDYVWIGNNAYISPGITIGENAIIGANTVVRKNVPSWTIVRPPDNIRYKKHKTND